MVHIIKIYFATPKNEVEIRRLTISSDTVSNFNLLLEKIRNVFQLSNAEGLNIKWKDPENDYILMSSNDELAQALANAEEGLLRLYVSLKVSLNSEQPSIPKSNGSKESHPFVVCDGCDKNIIGVRYKCLQCQNYDLCSSCDGDNKHPIHDMIKFVKPTYIPREWVFMGARKLWKSMFNRCPRNYFTYIEDENERVPSAENWMRNTGIVFSQRNSDSPAKDDTVPKSASSNLADSAPSASSSQQAKEKPSPSTSETQPNPKPFAMFPGNFLNCLQKDLPDAPKLIQQGLNEVLKVVQGTIENIDHSVYNPEFRRSHGNVNKAATSSNAPTQTTPTAEKPSTSNQTPETVLLDIANENVNNVPANNKPSASADAEDEIIIDLELEKSSNAVEEPALCPEGWTLLDGDTNKMDCNNANATNMESNRGNASEMECNGNATSTERNGNNTERVVYPDLMEVEANQERSKDYIQSTDPVIKSAVETMQAMGFTNEGGWLERLIISKQGNINDALEALYPSMRQ